MNHRHDVHWVGTWATTPAAVENIEVARQTVRMITRVSLGGALIRVRLSNACGTQDLHIGAAHVGLRSKGANIACGSNRALTFNDQTSITIPAGALVVSDPVELDVPPLADLAVSVFVPGNVSSDQMTGHQSAHQTNYVSPTGNFAAADDLPVQKAIESFLLVSGIEVEATRSVGTIVAFGDSLTEGNISELDANHRWPDQLARRLSARKDGRRFGVVNQGIGGNRLLHGVGIPGDNGVRRFDRDVLAQPGVTHVIVVLGVNDLRNSGGKAQEVVTAEALIAGLQQLAVRAKTAGLMVFGGTIMPYENNTFRGGFFTSEGEAKRQTVNAWIRKRGVFDSVIDFEAALRDPAHPTRLDSKWDSGDHLHPNDHGYLHMGDNIDLAIFES
jgi:lysophospholipase L1-like esterase